MIHIDDHQTARLPRMETWAKESASAVPYVCVAALAWAITLTLAYLAIMSGVPAARIAMATSNVASAIATIVAVGVWLRRSLGQWHRATVSALAQVSARLAEHDEHAARTYGRIGYVSRTVDAVQEGQERAEALLSRVVDQPAALTDRQAAEIWTMAQRSARR
jgi:hypothetical protein